MRGALAASGCAHLLDHVPAGSGNVLANDIGCGGGILRLEGGDRRPVLAQNGGAAA